MSWSQNEIVEEYTKLKESNDFQGRTPTSREFYDKTPVTKGTAEKAFGEQAYSKIQKAAGDVPNEFGSEGRTEQEFFEIYGEAVRSNVLRGKGHPTKAQWKHEEQKPTVDGYCYKFECNWSDMPAKFCEWAPDNEQWADVVSALAGAIPTERKPETDRVDRGYVYLMKMKQYYTIGKSDHTGRRQYEHERKLPEKPELIHEIETDDPFGVEAYWHNRFTDKRTETDGSWYKLDQYSRRQRNSLPNLLPKRPPLKSSTR